MQSVRKISALILSMLVLLSSMSFTLNIHLCMGEIDSIALFKEARACEMATQVAPCAKEKHKGHDHQINKKGCCEDHSFFIEGQDEITKTASVAMPDVAFVAVLHAVVAYLSVQPSVVDTHFYKAYSPPLIEQDIPVLVQSFLI